MLGMGKCLSLRRLGEMWGHRTQEHLSENILTNLILVDCYKEHASIIFCLIIARGEITSKFESRSNEKSKNWLPCTDYDC